MVRRVCSIRRSILSRVRQGIDVIHSTAPQHRYNRAAKLIEQMEKEGIVGPANHVGKREVLVRRTNHDDD